MHAIELPAEIDANKQIHLQLPPHVQAVRAKVIVMYEESRSGSKPLQLGMFAGKVMAGDDFDEPLPEDFWLDDSLK